jgi:hypothetical protein
MRAPGLIAGLAILAALHSPARAQQASPLEAEGEHYRREAIERVIDSHDPELIMGAARLYLKQRALKCANRLVGQWGREAGLGLKWHPGLPQWQQAERLLLVRAQGLTERRFENRAWIREAWSAYMTAQFSGEEADHIADHFETEGGREQRKLMDWFLGEFVLFNYTFTDRIQYDLPGSREELLRLQRAAQERLPREDVHFSSRFEDTLPFIGRDPGLKYWKMLAIPLLGGILRHVDSLAQEIEAQMLAQRAVVQPLIDAYAAGS